MIGYITYCDSEDLPYDILSDALEQKLSAPNRVICTDATHAAIAVGFPELDRTTNELYVWPRDQKKQGSSANTVILRDCGQIIHAVTSAHVPREVIKRGKDQVEVSGYLEIVDLLNHKLRYLPVPQ